MCCLFYCLICSLKACQNKQMELIYLSLNCNAMKRMQVITIWFLPLVVIGGVFHPVLGYLVVAMMAFFLTLSFFKGRYWCWNLCPRGAFLDIILSKFSLNRFIPRIFLKQWFRWLVFALFIVFLIIRLVNSGGDWLSIGSVFVGMCILTTTIAIVLGVFTRHRSWCTVCPMGTLQEHIYKMNKPNNDLRSRQPDK